jgi:hypothetical protein
MQRETALALLGVVVFIVLVLIAYATQIFHPPKPSMPPAPPPSQATAASPATPSTPPPSAPSQPSGSALQNPIVATPSIPETPPMSVGQARQPAPSLASHPTVLPPVPGVGTPPPSPPISADEPLLNEAVRWAKAIVEQGRPWQVRLFTAADPRMGQEGFALTLNGNRLEVYARTSVGWLYGLLEVADRLSNGEEIPPRWRWTPPIAERGWVEAVSSFAPTQGLFASRLRGIIRERLRSLARQRFNVWVLESNGQEPVLSTLLTEAKNLAPLYGVRIVLWAPMTPTVRAWQGQGGTVISRDPHLPNIILAANDPTATKWLETKVVALPLQDGHLFAPTLPPFLKTVPHRWRSRLILVGGPEGAHEGLFWFDPEWAQALVRAMRDEKVGGFWLRVRSVPVLWGAAAFGTAFRDPDGDTERFWRTRWSRSWGPRAPLWLTAFQEASRIMPDVLTLLGTAPDGGFPFRPQWGVPLPFFFSRRPVSAEWGISVLSVSDTLREAGALERTSTLTAVEIAQRLHRHADTILDILSQLPDPADPAWQQAKRAATLNGWLGKHFAFKVEAALAWGRFEAGERAAGATADMALDNAVRAWQQAVVAADALYGPNNEWARRLAWWQQEARQYRTRLARAPALP